MAGLVSLSAGLCKKLLNPQNLDVRWVPVQNRPQQRTFLSLWGRAFFKMFGYFSGNVVRMRINDMKIFLNKMEIMIPSALCCCARGWLLQIWWSQIMVKQLWVVTSDTNTGLVLTELKGTVGLRRSLFLSNMNSDGCWEAVYGWHGSQNNSAASAKLCWRIKVTFGLWGPKIYSACMNVNLSFRSLSSVLSS